MYPLKVLISFPLDIYPEVKFLVIWRFVVVVFSKFILFSKEVIPAYILAKSVQGSLLSTFSPMHDIYCLFDTSYCSRWGDISLWFRFAFPLIISDIGQLFCILVDHLYVFLENCLFRSFSVFFFFFLNYVCVCVLESCCNAYSLKP